MSEPRRGARAGGPPGEPAPADEAPPFASWGALYAIVIAALALAIAALAWLTGHWR